MIQVDALIWRDTSEYTPMNGNYNFAYLLYCILLSMSDFPLLGHMCATSLAVEKVSFR